MRALVIAIGLCVMCLGCVPYPEGTIACDAASDCPKHWVCEAKSAHAVQRYCFSRHQAVADASTAEAHDASPSKDASDADAIASMSKRDMHADDRDSGPAAGPSDASTLFEVIETSPAAGAELTELDAPIRIRFSSEPDLHTAEDGGVRISRDGRDVQGKWTREGDSLRFMPQTPWVLSARYHVAISSSLEDVRQRAIRESAYEISVRAGRWASQSVAQHPNDRLIYTTPQLKLTRDGTGLLLWSVHDSPKYTYSYSSRFTASRTWTAPYEYSGFAVGAGVDPMGHMAVAVESVGPDPTPDRLFRFMDDWASEYIAATELTVADKVYVASSVADFCMNDRDQLFLLLAAHPPEGSSLLAIAESRFADMLAEPRVLDNTIGFEQASVVPYDSSYLSIWMQSNDDHSQTALWSSCGGGFGCEPRAITRSPVTVSSPMLRSDPLERSAIALWVQNEQPWPSIWGARLVQNTPWTDPAPISNRQGAVSSPDLALDEHGGAIAVWLQADGAATHVWSARFDPMMGRWTDPTSLSGSAQITADQPHIALEAHGNAIATWQESKADDAASIRLRWARYISGVGWRSESEPIATTERPQNEFFSRVESSVAMDAAGRAIAAWADNANVWAAIYE